MQRTVRAALAVAALVMVGAGTAATVKGTNHADVLSGTLRPDRISARGGNDRVAAQQGGRDRVRCGRGWDTVTASRNDRVAADCEVVSRQLSRDLHRDRFAQHESQVEPDSFSYGSTTVAVFQSGRYADGGATLIGFATSVDGGRRWRSGFLPGLTTFSPHPGTARRTSDPSVAYDAVHRVWLAVSLVFGGSSNGLTVNRSSDGLRWNRPVDAARSIVPSLRYDKEWIACDNWAGSPFRGRCYLSYTDVHREEIVTQVSRDGGKTWAAAVGSPAERRPAAVGAMPVIYPDGTLRVAFADASGMVYAESANGGETFTSGRVLADGTARNIRGIRESPLPSADVGLDGTAYVTWHECDTRPHCNGNDVVLSVSRNGGAWSEPVALPTGPRRAGDEYFAPAITVDPSAPERVAVLYYSAGPCSCSLSAWLVSSGDGGATWGSRVRLSSQAMRRRWIAETPGGTFLGDYFSVSFSDGRPVPVFSDATRPAHGRLRQAIFATTRGL
jgi:hypothetical protein